MDTPKPKTRKIKPTEDSWDTGELGRSAAHAKRAPVTKSAELDDALGLQLISIRLPRQLLDELKMLAQMNAMGYQPLVRQVLTRFTQSEMKRIAGEQIRQASATQTRKAA